MGFWLQLGVSGFRMDAAPFLIELKGRAGQPGRRQGLRLPAPRCATSCQWRRRRRDPAGRGERRARPDRATTSASGDSRLPHAVQLPAQPAPVPGAGHARTPSRSSRALKRRPAAAARTASGPTSCATTTRSTSAGSTDERARAGVRRRSGPEPDMQLYGRGIRRRLAPMLGGDRAPARAGVQPACSRCPARRCSAYGEEIGMGDDLSLPERERVRTPMQWSSEPQRRLLDRAAGEAGPAR